MASILDPGAAEYVPRRQQSVDAPPTFHGAPTSQPPAGELLQAKQQALPQLAVPDVNQLYLQQLSSAHEQIVKLTTANRVLTDQQQHAQRRVGDLEVQFAAHTLMQQQPQQQQQQQPPPQQQPRLSHPGAMLAAPSAVPLPVTSAAAVYGGPGAVPPLGHLAAAAAVAASGRVGSPLAGLTSTAMSTQQLMAGNGLAYGSAASLGVGQLQGFATANGHSGLEARVQGLEHQLKAAHQRIQELLLASQKPVDSGEKAILINRINTLEEQLAIQRADSGQSAHTAYNLQLKLAHANNKAKLAEQAHRKEQKAAQATIASQQQQIEELLLRLQCAESAATMHDQLRTVATNVWS